MYARWRQVGTAVLSACYIAVGEKSFWALKSEIFESKYNCAIDNNGLTLKLFLAPHFKSSFKLKKFDNMAEMLLFSFLR